MTAYICEYLGKQWLDDNMFYYEHENLFGFDNILPHRRTCESILLCAHILPRLWMYPNISSAGVWAVFPTSLDTCWAPSRGGWRWSIWTLAQMLKRKNMPLNVTGFPVFSNKGIKHCWFFRMKENGIENIYPVNAISFHK